MPSNWRDLADFSDWVSFADALTVAPREPGVYVASVAGYEGSYVGMAGLRDRRGAGSPQGIRGRLARYASGKALASGLGEAVFDRALADADWLRDRLEELNEGHPRRASEWGRLAFVRADLQVCWAITSDAESARQLESEVLAALRAQGEPWNRTR